MERLVFLVSVILALSKFKASTGSFFEDFQITWGDGRAKILEDGRLLTLSLDKASGSGFQSRKEYLFGRIDMQVKLVPGNSAGTVTAYYLSSQGADHDEIDFEFLGNVSGQPYTIHTNVFARGKGGREQQFRPWFDPTAAFHTYSILWTPRRIIFLVDETPIREFKNAESVGVPFPRSQAMRIYSSLWNADDWATQGGRVKTDWSLAPFTASYGNFDDGRACVWRRGACTGWPDEEPDSEAERKLKWVRDNYMIYDYCEDVNRSANGLPPPECSISP